MIINPISAVNYPSTLAGSDSNPELICLADFTQKRISTSNARVTTSGASYEIDPDRTGHIPEHVDGGVVYHPEYQGHYVMKEPGKSFLEVDFTLFPGDKRRSMILSFSHKPSSTEANPIQVFVNGKPLETVYVNPDYNDVFLMNETYDITDYLQEGPNTIRIEFLPKEGADYKIKKLEVYAWG